MEKDMIRDQKVFVRLESVLDLAKRYSEVASQYEQNKGAITPATRELLVKVTAEKRTIEQIIGILGLPIQRV